MTAAMLEELSLVFSLFVAVAIGFLWIIYGYRPRRP